MLVDKKKIYFIELLHEFLDFLKFDFQRKFCKSHVKLLFWFLYRIRLNFCT